MSTMKKAVITKVGKLYEPLTKRFVKKQYAYSLPLTRPESGRVLVLAPHVDDETIGAGGTILTHKQHGAKVTVIYLTDGSGSQSETAGAELSLRRKEEAKQVQELLRIDDVFFLDAKDGQLNEATKSDAFLASFRKHVEAVDPNVIYLPTMIDCHPDHVAVGELLMGLSGEWTVRLYEINTAIPPQHLNCVVDVSEHQQQKEAAIDVFTSQTIDFDGFLNLSAWKSVMAEEKGKPITHVETFLEMPQKSFQLRYPALQARKIRYADYLKQMNKTATLPVALAKNQKQKNSWYDMAMGGGKS